MSSVTYGVTYAAPLMPTYTSAYSSDRPTTFPLNVESLTTAEPASA